jgi:hypothetical protein
MTTTVKLKDLIDALEEQSDSMLPFLDRDTGEAFVISEERLANSEDLGEVELEAMQDWEREEARVAHAIATTDRYLALPDRFEVDEWNIMREFSEGVQNDEARAVLLGVTRGSHAFRRFKNEIANRNLSSSWFAYRSKAFEEVVRAWCEEHGIEIKADDDSAQVAPGSSNPRTGG